MNRFTCVWGDGYGIVLFTACEHRIDQELSFAFELLRRAHGR